MITELLRHLRRACSIGAVAIAVSVLPGYSQTSTYTVNGPNSLTAIAAQIQGKTSGVHRVRFKTYQNVGQFSITNLSADSLIFERSEESAEVVEFTGTLFKFENITTPVVFRNLAFKAKDGSSVIVNGRASENQNLLLDSCQMFADSLNSTFFSWLSNPGAKVEIRRSIVASLKGGDGKILVTADSLIMTNTYLNFAGLITAITSKFLRMEHLTTNRVQFNLNGNVTGLFRIGNNIFGHPPFQSKLPGEPPKKSVMSLDRYLGTSSAQNNARFTSWTGFDYWNSSPLDDPSNTSITPFGDTTALWSFQNPSDNLRGYLNPPEANFPAYTVFPQDTVLPISLSSKDSLILSITPAQIPRVVTGKYNSVSYPSNTDSTRSLWLKDTALHISGPVSIQNIFFPKAISQGKPILFSQSGSLFSAGSLGVEGSTVFFNAQPAARIFIPAFASQNTFKGTSIALKGYGADTALIFSSVTRAGGTTFQSSTLSTGNKRWRAMQRSGKPISFKDTTNAEGAGEIQFGFGNANGDVPFDLDSLGWWMGGTSFTQAKDSVGKYWGKSPFASSIQALLLERLAVGKGHDTIPLTQGRIITSSANGHQLKVDSTFQPDQAQFPDMGSFSKSLSFRWAGRAVGDSLALTLAKSTPLQKAFVKNGAQAILITPSIEDSTSVTFYLGTGDTGKSVFLARKYAIAAAVKTDLVLGQDSLKGILSSAPGDILLDEKINKEGLSLVKALFLTGRVITLDNLKLQSDYALNIPSKTPIVKDSVHAYAFKAGSWKEVTVVQAQGRYTFTLDATTSQVALLEGLSAPVDTVWTPLQSAPTFLTRGDTVAVRLQTTPLEKSRILSYTVQLLAFTLDGIQTLDSTIAQAPDSTALLTFKSGRAYAYRFSYQSTDGKTHLDSLWRNVPGKAFTSSAVQGLSPVKPKRQFQLIGLPFDGSYKGNLEPGIAEGVKKNKTLLFGLKGRAWDTLVVNNNKDYAMPRGQGFLFGALEPFRVQIKPSDSLSLESHKIAWNERGWKIITNPFPFNYPLKNAQASGKVSMAMALKSGSADSTDTTYQWTETDTLKPFQGYAIFAYEASTMTFPAYRAPSLPKRAVASAGKVSSEQKLKSGSLKITVSGNNAWASTTLFTEDLYRETPGLPVPGSDFELSISDGQPWFYKSVSGLGEISESLRMITGKHVKVNFQAKGYYGNGSPSDIQIGIYNHQTGQVIPLKQSAILDLPAGDNNFTLVAGNPEYVSAQLGTLAQSLPSGFHLFQNSPNPSRGLTEIRFEVPSLKKGTAKGVVEIFNAQGRLVYNMDLGVVRVGMQSLRVGTSGFKRGIYFYRVSLQLDDKSFKLQRKMLVQD